MSVCADLRRKIAALRAKADSTTFPAEAEACRAKADELEASLPKRQEPHCWDGRGWDGRVWGDNVRPVGRETVIIDFETTDLAEFARKIRTVLAERYGMDPDDLPDY